MGYDISGGGGFNHFFKFGDIIKSKKGNRVRHLIWLATTWCIWRLRNNIVFRGKVADYAVLVDNINVISWIWFSGRSGRKTIYSFYDWCSKGYNMTLI
jgi:hypothetical protein